MAGLLDKETQSLSGVNCLIPHETQVCTGMLHAGPKNILKIILSLTGSRIRQSFSPACSGTSPAKDRRVPSSIGHL